MIDDRPDVETNNGQATWCHVVFDHPYNQQSAAVLRIRGWDDPLLENTSEVARRRTTAERSGGGYELFGLDTAPPITSTRSPCPCSMATNRIPLEGVEPSHVVLATLADDRSRLVAAFSKLTEVYLTGPDRD